MTFGEFVRQKRIAIGKSLRAFCLEYHEDPSNWSKWERGVLPPPEDYSRLQDIARKLGVEEKDEQMLFDLAAAERGKFPKDLIDDPELIKSLPLVFRTLRGEVPSKTHLLKLADMIRKDRSAR